MNETRSHYRRWLARESQFKVVGVVDGLAGVVNRFSAITCSVVISGEAHSLMLLQIDETAEFAPAFTVESGLGCMCQSVHLQVVAANEGFPTCLADVRPNVCVHRTDVSRQRLAALVAWMTTSLIWTHVKMILVHHLHMTTEPSPSTEFLPTLFAHEVALF